MLNLEGRQLGGCRLIRKIGEGGMGEVYLAEQIKVGNRQVAIKVMRPDSGAYSADTVDEAKRRFEREAATLGKLEHPNILPIYDAGIEDDYFYITMQYAPDGSLADCIRGRSRRALPLPLGVAMAIDFVSQVAAALQFIHDQGFVHRDVKPANVLTREIQGGGWRMLLADFGVARGLDNTSQRTQVTGTFTYMAPEQFHGQFSPATDQYALAVMTYQLLAGRPPFEGELGAVMRAHMNEQPPSLRALNPAVPVGVEAAVMRGLAKDPGARFPSVATYAQALQSGLSDLIPPPLPPDVGQRQAALGATPPAPPRWPSGEPQKPARRAGLGRVWLVALAAALIVVSVAGASLFVNNQNQIHAVATRTALAHATLTARASTQSPTSSTTVTATTSVTPAVSVTPASSPTPPPLPANAGTKVFDSAAPFCDSSDTVVWTKGNGAQTNCPGGSMTSLVSTTAGLLACINAQAELQANGYLVSEVTSQSGQVVLGYRQGAGDPVSGGFRTTGYYVAVDPAAGQVVMYSVDHTGTAHSLSSVALSASLPSVYYVSAIFDGSTMTVTVNGQTLPSVTDSAYANGWVAACTTGSSTFSHVQLYNLTS